MSRYIDAEALDNRIKAEWAKQEDDKGYGLAHFFVATQPTADVAPVVHAHWCIDGETFSCSSCGATFFGLSFNTQEQNEKRLKDCYQFCPVCGARMDEEVKEDGTV